MAPVRDIVRAGKGGRDSNVNLEIFWLPCFAACCSRTWNRESSATASQAQCEAERRRWVFNADGVDALLFVPKSRFPEIPGSCLLGLGWYQA